MAFSHSEKELRSGGFELAWLNSYKTNAIDTADKSSYNTMNENVHESYKEGKLSWKKRKTY